MERKQRTVFGEVASTYDTVRATYPDEVIDRICRECDLGDRSLVLDIGCGTGILAGRFIERGHRVLGIEPSAGMAKIARRKFAGNRDFRLHLVDFERWSPGPERFDLAVAGQSWHWMDPETRFAHAARALEADAHLALLWNAPAKRAGALESAIDDAYRQHAPHLSSGPPGSKAGLGGADPGDEITSDAHFSMLAFIEVPWTTTYDSATYRQLLSTQSNHRLLDPKQNDLLQGQISHAIDTIGGGQIAVDYVCRAYVAVKS